MSKAIQKERELIQEIMCQTGMSYEEAKASWYFKNPTEAREIDRFITLFIRSIRSVTVNHI